MGELVLHVIGIVGPIVVVLMTTPAIGGCSGVLPVDMTLRAVGLRVSARQWELRLAMVKR